MMKIKVRLQKRYSTAKPGKMKHEVYQITLPKLFIKHLHWEKRDPISVSLKENKLTLEKELIENGKK